MYLNSKRLSAIVLLFSFATFQTAYAAGPSGASKLRRVWTQGDLVVMYAAVGDEFSNPDQCGAGNPTIDRAMFVAATPTTDPNYIAKSTAERDRALSIMLTAVTANMTVESYFSGCHPWSGGVPIFHQIGARND